jgi:intracellular septation protein
MRLLVFDFASSLLFLAILLITRNIYVATALGIVAGVTQLIWLKTRHETIDPIQWMSVGLVAVMGTASIVTQSPRFVMIKPSIIQACIAIMMLRPGWCARYVPAFAKDLVPHWLLVLWGYLWAAVMLALAGSSLAVAYYAGQKTWAIFTTLTPWLVMGLLVAATFAVFPRIVRRNARARGVALPSHRG